MIIVKEVTSKALRKAFVTFPIKLYKNCPYFVPALYSDEMKEFNPKKNPNLEECEYLAFLAYKDKKIVGRIGVITNPPADRKFNTKRLRFRAFDVIDDFEVTKALFSKVLEVMESKGAYDLEGPNGFTDCDKEGMLIEGFDRCNLFFTYYNYPYYRTHLEKLGFSKMVDWNEYCLNLPSKMDPRLEKIANLVMRKGYKVVKVKNHRELEPYIMPAFKIYNDAFAELYGTVPLNEKQVQYTLGEFFPLLNIDYISIIKDKNDEIVGFAVVVPSLGKVSKQCHGKLFPWGFIPFLRALRKNDTIDMLLIGVKPQLQGLGINGLLIYEILKTCIKHHIKYAETGPELEDNLKVQSQWSRYDAPKVRKRRLFYITKEDLKKNYE